MNHTPTSIEEPTMDIAAIPILPEREERFDAILVDCYGEAECLSAFGVYLGDALRTPFAAWWGAPASQRLPVTVLGTAADYDDDGIVLRVQRSDGDEQEVLADQLWAVEDPSINATVLDDYRAWVASGGLPFNLYDEE
jgi:hypothetical protein